MQLRCPTIRFQVELRTQLEITNYRSSQYDSVRWKLGNSLKEFRFPVAVYCLLLLNR